MSARRPAAHRILPVALAAAALAAAAPAARAKGLTIDDMLAMQRVGEPAVSPDGRWVAFSVRDTDLEANRGRTDVWLAAADGSSVTRLTTDPENDGAPAWSADGRAIYFVSSRSGTPQVWRIAPAGGEAEQVTKLPVGINGFRLFPDGKRLLLAVDVWPEAKDLADSAARDEALAKAPPAARVYDQLLFRHWDTWEDGKYSHLLVWSPPSLGGKADEARDLTPGQRTDSPTHPFGGMEEIAVTPDGGSVLYTARVGGRAIAWTTNTDVFLVDAAGRSKPVNLTAANPAYDTAPVVSPDGKRVAYLAMARAGYESDKQRIAVIELATRSQRVVAEGWDRSAGALAWSADGRTIYAAADDLGNKTIFAVDVASGKATALVSKGTNDSPLVARDRIVYVHDTLRQPEELWSVRTDGSDARAITHLNDQRVAAITWGDYEQFQFTGAHNDTVYGFLVKPAGYDGRGKRRVPVALIIHGGPQGSMGDHFHYRWNPEVFAGAGFGVVFIDFHGSTGYGQAFVDAIRGDWGGAPYQDVMAGLDAALARYPWLDGSRAVALGASYGGYMINWIAGHTDRFKALVCHDGNLDERMAYFDTEELWFPEWEHGGTPWEKPSGYMEQSPLEFVKNWKTPMLVVHGGNDFRVVDTQGMATFTALQRRGIPSRLVLFPDENHWVLKPQGTKQWHAEVLGWIQRWTATGPRRVPPPG